MGTSLALGLAVLLLSFLRIAGDAQGKGFRGSLLSTVFTGDIWGSILVRNLALFALALIVLHLLFGLACWLTARASAIAWPSRTVPLRHHVFIWFLVMTVGLLTNNAATFPRSSLGSPYAQAMMTSLAGLALGTWIGLATLAGAAITFTVALRKRRATLVRSRKPLLAGTGILVCAIVMVIALPSATQRALRQSQPNVILIGIDSLRPDIVASDPSPRIAPHVEDFLARSASFSNAITPLARTFPSVTTLLTGRSPHRTGAVVNLLPRTLIREGDTLGRLLGRAGYATTYATDEIRFSNIDRSYGFDTEITPPIGASEFLITLFCDTPLSNLVVNTRVGAWLFPHVHGNRGGALTYDPDLFVERIDREVRFDRPQFLHVHLTLPHWPYTWVDAPVPLTAMGAKTDEASIWPQFYRDAVQRADQQFADLMARLERRGALDNAIVVLYSDHGEAFGYDAESILHEESAEILALGAKPGFGHGTSVLSPHQYEVVLAVRGFGAARTGQMEGRRIDSPVSVLDVAPTLVELLDAYGVRNPRTPFDGRSLVPLLRGDPLAPAAFAQRIRFTETEFDPVNVLSTPAGRPSASAIADAAIVYRVNPATDRIEIRASQLHTLLHSRQYAAIGPRTMLAALPVPQMKGYEYFLFDRQSALAVRLTGPPGADASEEVRGLWTALHAEFATVLSQSASGL